MAKADTKDTILDAAEDLFAEQGFGATSLRQLTARAGVNLAAVNYHFGSKKALWQAAAEHLMSITERDLGTALSHMNQIDEAQQLRFFVRAYVKFCAKHPELNRLMIQEGMAQDWRLTWLLERSVRPWYAQVCRVFNRATQLGIAPQMDAHHFYYALTGAATLMFSNAAEATALSGKNPQDPATVDAHADAVANLFTSIRKPL